MKNFLERNLPPGYSYKAELSTVIIAFSLLTIISFFGFLGTFLRLRRMLFMNFSGVGVIVERPIMPDFIYILDNSLLYYLIFGILTFIIASAVHYAYYHTGSKSIYLMRRLPNSFERHQRSLLIPTLFALAFLLTAVMLFFIYFAIYMIFTPEGALVPGQWQRIWSVLGSVFR